MKITVNGISLFYKKTGQGKPILLLHGNGEEHSIFDVLTRQLSASYTVYALDSRDHGKSDRVDVLNYSDMMQDTAAFIRALGIKPILYGFSDGGIIGLLLAIKYPELLDRLIISGANLSPQGIKKKELWLMRLGYFFTRSRKLKLMLTQPDIKVSDLNKITTPTVVLAGSDEFCTDEHTRLIAKSIPNSVLNILEGESHSSYVVNSDKLYGVIKEFL
ncbi:MAG: alpha/beta hydrolase [Defluviitaleaceae bacterium]|nr:alpha/beta hydrolase [Defluviitaleaceae bacterium]